MDVVGGEAKAAVDDAAADSPPLPPLLDESFTYGEEWRARATQGLPLASGERSRLLAERQWDRENASLRARLEAFVGTTVWTLSDLSTIDGRTVDAGTRFFVRCRSYDRLVGESERWGVLLLRVDWIEIAPQLPIETRQHELHERPDRTDDPEPRLYADAGVDADPIGDLLREVFGSE